MTPQSAALRVVPPKEAPAGTSPVLARDLAVNQIVPSETNPRKRFVEQNLKELTDNVKQHGVVQTISVRPWTATEADVKAFRNVAKSVSAGFKVGDKIWKLIFGERRWRASLAAGRDTIPATIRELSDAEVEEVQMIENLQREDLHWLDAAFGYQHYLKAHGGTEKLEAVTALAAKVGKSVSYVYGYVQLTSLIKPVQQLGYAGHITPSHALEICKWQPKDQERCLIECFGGHVEDDEGRHQFKNYKTAADVQKDKNPILNVSVRQLRRWIAENLMLDLKKAPFNPEDAELVPAAGACTTCPKRTGNNPSLFPDVRNGDVCTDQECFNKKKEAFLLVQIRETKHEKVAKVRLERYFHGKDPKDVLQAGQYVLATKDCINTVPVVIVDADRFGEITRRCMANNCPHHKVQRYSTPSSPAERAKRTVELRKQRIQRDFRDRLAVTVKDKLPNKIGNRELGLLAKFMQHRLSHDDARRLVRLYEWPEEKTKNRWSGMIVDHRKIIENQVKKMKPGDLPEFILSCTFLGDLYIPGFNPNETLRSGSLLRAAATAYRVDHTRIFNTVKSEVEKKSKNKKKASKSEGKKKQPQKTAKER